MMSPLHVPCPLCGADRPALRYAARGSGELAADAMACTSTGLARHGPVVTCTACGMVYADPRPAADDLERLYREVEDATYEEQRRGRELTFRRLLHVLHRHRRPPGQLLDVGCYTGVFLAEAAAAGWRVSGSELSAWAAGIARAQGLGAVYEEPLEELPVGAGSCDVVTMWDVLEHLPDPRRSLLQVAELLAPGGVLALSTHVIDCLAARLLGTRYPFLMDMHLVHFSRATLTRLLDECGFALLSLSGHRRTLMLDYLLGRVWSLLPSLRPVLAPLASLRVARAVPVTVRGHGVVDVVARKR